MGKSKKETLMLKTLPDDNQFGFGAVIRPKLGDGLHRLPGVVCSTSTSCSGGSGGAAFMKEQK